MVLSNLIVIFSLSSISFKCKFLCSITLSFSSKISIFISPAPALSLPYVAGYKIIPTTSWVYNSIVCLMSLLFFNSPIALTLESLRITSLSFRSTLYTYSQNKT